MSIYFKKINKNNIKYYMFNTVIFNRGIYEYKNNIIPYEVKNLSKGIYGITFDGFNCGLAIIDEDGNIYISEYNEFTNENYDNTIKRNKLIDELENKGYSYKEIINIVNF